MLLATDMSFHDQVVLGLVIAFATASLTVFSQPFMHWLNVRILGPKVVISFDNDQDCVFLAPKCDLLKEALGEVPPNHSTPVYYVRIKVTNLKRRIASDCRGYLVRIEKKTQYGWDVLFADSLPLIWSFASLNAATIIPHNLTKHLDVITINKDERGFIPQIRDEASGKVFYLFPLRDRFESFGLFRFTVLVSAQDIASKTIQITLHAEEGKWPWNIRLAKPHQHQSIEARTEEQNAR